MDPVAAIVGTETQGEIRHYANANSIYDIN